MESTFTRVHLEAYADLHTIKTNLGSFFFRDTHSYQILSGLDSAQAKKALHKYYEKHYDGKDFPSVLTNPPDSEHVCTFVNPTSGKSVKAFSLTGLEFLCNHITGKNAEENKPKFLALIKKFRSSIADQPADNTQLIMQSLPVILSQAITGPLQALMTRQAETFHEQVKGMAKVMVEKDLECEKVKHTAEMEKTKFEAEMLLERTNFEADRKLDKTKYENEAKVKDINHQIELERSKHEAERVQWELKAAEIRQAKREEAAISKPPALQLPENPPPVHANLKAETSCLWLALYDAEVRRDNYDFNRINTFVKACSSVLIDSDENTWVALIELERPMVLNDIGKEMRLLAKDVSGVQSIFFSSPLNNLILTFSFALKDIFTGPVFLESREGRSTSRMFPMNSLHDAAKGDYFNRESKQVIQAYAQRSPLLMYAPSGSSMPMTKVSA